MTPPTPSTAAGPRQRAGQPLRLMDDDPSAVHPLTTLATPLLPSRDAAGSPVDVWEELDRAAAWVCDHWSARGGVGGGGGVRTADEAEGAGSDGRNELRHALRVLCVAARSADAIDHGSGSAPALRARDLPWNVPVARLLRAVQQRLVVQTVAADAAGDPAPDPGAVLRVLAALDRLDEIGRGDAARTVVDQLTGASSLDLLVEVAHDMRSPLGSILFLVERVRLGQAGGGPLTEAQDRQLALVYGAAFGLSSMVGDVMELARGGDRLAAGEPAPLSLAEVVEGVCAIVRPLAEERRLRLVVGEVPGEARVGHAAGIQRVLLNLVTNALKYTPEGSVTVRVEAAGPARMRFTVEDTGRGIPPQVLANLFQTFRPRDARDYAFSSAGLGLAICQKLIRAMGGELEVDSEAGRGTRFEFEVDLPAAPVAGW